MRRRTTVTAWFTSASVMLSSNSNSSTTASTKRSRHSGGSPFAPWCTSARCSRVKADGRGLVIAVVTDHVLRRFRHARGRVPLAAGVAVGADQGRTGAPQIASYPRLDAPNPARPGALSRWSPWDPSPDFPPRASNAPSSPSHRDGGAQLCPLHSAGEPLNCPVLRANALNSVSGSKASIQTTKRARRRSRRRPMRPGRRG